MFKSAENLRLAADMRALERVAAPWRAARRTWFDGTPESIEARLAATERVLTYARGGMTPAHMALEREAAAARGELREASHRLMADFLDDGARAFKGSRRVAGKHDADPDEPWKNRATGEDTPTEHWENLHLSPFDDEDDYEGKHRESRVAAPMTSVGEGGSSLAGMGAEMLGNQGAAVSTSIPGAIAKGVWNGSTTTGQEPTPAFNPGPAKTAAGGADDPYHGKVWPHDFPLPEGTPAKWNDDDTLTCPNCGYDEVQLNRQGECPECDHYDADFIDDSDGDHNSFESQMERKYPILPEHGGPESGLWGGKWASRPFESARLAAGRTAAEMSWDDIQKRIDDQLSKGEAGMAAEPSTAERPVVNKHNHPIHQGQEVYWTDEHGIPEEGGVKGRIVSHPAIDPDGRADPNIAEVEWPDIGWDLHHVDELTPSDRHPGDWDPDAEQDPFDPRLIGASRTASNGGLDWQGDDDPNRPSGHEAYTEVGDLIQTHPVWHTEPAELPRRGTYKELRHLPPKGWGYGIWTNEPPEDGDYHGSDDWRNGGNRDGEYVHQGNSKIVYPTHDEAKAAAEAHYYSLDHSGRQLDYHDDGGGTGRSGVDYSDLNKFMESDGGGGRPGPDDEDYGDIFGKQSRLLARLAASGMSYEDAMAHINDVLDAGEGHDLHHQPGVDVPHSGHYDHSDIRDHCRACGGDGRAGDGEDCEGCGGTGENQGDPYGECEGCGGDFQVEDLTGDPDTGLYCQNCGGRS